jgi:hypothetical protein
MMAFMYSTSLASIVFFREEDDSGYLRSGVLTSPEQLPDLQVALAAEKLAHEASGPLGVGVAATQRGRPFHDPTTLDLSDEGYRMVEDRLCRLLDPRDRRFRDQLAGRIGKQPAIGFWLAVVVDASNLLNSPHRLPAATAKERADVDAFLRDQVQQGRVVDSSQIWVASGTNPLGGGDVSAAWEGGYRPVQFRFASTLNESAGAIASGYGVAAASPRPTSG